MAEGMLVDVSAFSAEKSRHFVPHQEAKPDRANSRAERV